METAAEPMATAAPARAGFRLLSHQKQIATDVLADLRAGKDEVLLAACPGFGKTEVAIWLIRELLREGKVKRVLVLPHGTNVLRQNFEDRLRLRAPGLMASGKVVVALPHGWKSIVGKFDLVVNDESHDFYEVEDGMVEKAIKQVGARQTLLLTGTPSPFIRRGLKAHAFALRELMECGRAADVQVILASSAWRVREKDWNRKGELRDQVSLSRKATEDTLGDVLDDLRDRVDLTATKTIIATRDVEMAHQVSLALARHHIEHLVSEHKEDENSANVRAFRLGPCPVLVVVKRATLGFDMPTLTTVIDMTGSRNPDRIFQMCCRLVRQSEEGASPSKLFVKVMPPVFCGDDLQFFMTGVMMLGDREVFTSWKGRSIYSLAVGVQAEKRQRGDSPAPRPLLARDMMTFGNLFAAVKAGFATTTLGAVLGKGPFPIEIDGQTKNASAWGREAGVSSETIMNRYRNGDRSRTSLLRPPRSSTSIEIEIDGVVKRLSAWAKAAGVSVSAMAVRYHKGYRGQALLQLLAPRRDAAALKIRIKGRLQSVLAWAREAGVSEQTIRDRLRKGVSGPSLLAPRSRKALAIRIGNRTQSTVAWAKEAGVSTNTLWRRYRSGVRGPALLKPSGRRGRRLPKMNTPQPPAALSGKQGHAP